MQCKGVTFGQFKRVTVWEVVVSRACRQYGHMFEFPFSRILCYLTMAPIVDAVGICSNFLRVDYYVCDSCSWFDLA